VIEAMEPPLEIPERTQFTDEAYGVLGRALSVATEFEGNCRALALLIGLREQPNITSDRASIDEFCQFMQRRTLAVHLKSVANAFDVSDDMESILNGARHSRNFITHEAAIGATRIFENSEEQEKFIQEVEGKIKVIAEANIWVVALSQAVTEEPLPTTSFFREYPNRVAEWVCEIEKTFV